MKLSEYLRLPREARVKHVDLSSPCVLERHKHPYSKTLHLRRELLELLGLENDLPSFARKLDSLGGLKPQVNRLCEHNTCNGGCENPLHAYFGSGSEAEADKDQEQVRELGQRRRQLTNEKRKQVGPNKVLRWLSTADGFVTTHVTPVVFHNRAVGAQPEDRVRLTDEEGKAVESFVEVFEWTSVTNHLTFSGRRLPKEHWPERVKAYLKKKVAT